ncbi:glutaredoxin [Salpingoeca rosetta]|uniref:Glutaredoxin n=1 Tax=Salpingoeca rosetta (strain ATCC 50818 / BSB-021) TaxID=946362 RepID=F2TYV5_SALR5|nr:glutaredoxin [Salpingoeca rosetta]EGD78779.1 glutaredoxin [Salpingoeca rosetta]|eukprot:XP_004997735.1 glutaredoxin [Salpingoeca rosetta]
MASLLLRHAARAAFNVARPRMVTAPFVRCYALAPEVKQRIDDMVQNNKLFVFMKGTPEAPMCGFSRAVVQVLELHGMDPLDLQTANVLEDDSIRNGIKEYSDWPTIPQVYVNGEFVGGCDLMIQMHQSGELVDLLKGIGHTSPYADVQGDGGSSTDGNKA